MEYEDPWNVAIYIYLRKSDKINIIKEAVSHIACL
jgi:hypothetical protein